MSGWIDIGRLEEIPRQGARIIARHAGDIAVFRTVDDNLFAVLDHCPHKGGPLSQGIVHGAKVTCPLHNWVIELRSGQALAPDQGCVKRFPVRIEDGQVWLQLTPIEATAHG
jgi:nitrite reductase (NADH) small subunit